MKKTIKIAIWVVATVVVVVGLVSVVAGPVAKAYINKNGEKLIGRTVSVKHVGVNLFGGRVKVRQIDIYEEDGKSRFAGLDTLDVAVSLLKLPFHTLQLRHVTLAGLYVNVEQQGEKFNFGSIIDHLAADSTQEKDTTPSEWTMKLYNIRIARARLKYDDLRNGKSWSLPDVNLKVPGFVVGGEEDSQGGLDIGFEHGGRLNIDANIDTRSNDFVMSVRLKDFDVENVANYTEELLADGSSIEGRLTAQLTARGNLDDIGATSVAGTVTVNDVAAREGRTDVAAFDSLNVEIGSIRLEPMTVNIAAIRLTGLGIHYQQWEDGNSMSRLLRQEEPSEQAITLQTTAEESKTTSESQTKPMTLNIGTLRVENATVTYSDHTLPDEFTFPITGLTIAANGIGTNRADNNARVRATLPGGGHLAANWSGDIAHWKRSQDVFLTVKGMDMRELSPLTVAYTGQPIEDGTLGITAKATISNSQLDNLNKIDIYKVRVGSRRKDVEPEMKVPLKTALYILKDKDEKILIDLPVNGDVDSPEFSYMKLVWKTLGQLLVKVATSPARAIGRAMGLDGEDLEFMEIDPTQHGLTSEQYHHLNTIASIANSDSLMTLTIEQVMPEATDDSTVMRYTRLSEQTLRYLSEQGIGEQRVSFVVSEANEGDKRWGYRISSAIEIAEE